MNASMTMMRKAGWSWAVAAAGLMMWLLGAGGCSTPSVHTIATPDTVMQEDGLVGTWQGEGESGGYVISKDGSKYAMKTMEEGGLGETYTFEMTLVRIGDKTYADFCAPESVQRETGDKWGPMFVPTHLFARWELKGDTLTVWMLDREWVERATQAGTVNLAHTRLDRDTVLITADTAALQKFLSEQGASSAAFANATTLKRKAQ